MWKAEKIELTKNSDTYWKDANYLSDTYTLSINGVTIYNRVNPKLLLPSGCFQNEVCTYCAQEGCESGGMLRIVRHQDSLFFIPCFDEMENYLEHDGNAADNDYGDTECPPHEWYENGILEVDETMLPKFLELLTGFNMQEIPFVKDEEMTKVEEWEKLVKEKPNVGFMR